MQFLNKKTQRFVQEKIPWDVQVPYTKQSSSRKALQSRSASAESPTLQGGSGGYSDSYGSLDGYDAENSPVRRRRHSNEIEAVRPSSIGEEELQLQLALAMSREEHEEEVRKQKSDDIKLQMALDESRRQQADEGHQTLAGLADQSRQKQQATDPWGAPMNKPPSDPWGASLPAPPGSHKHQPAAPPTSDPWASPQHKPTPPADPWSSPPASSSPAQQKPSNDPWGTPTSQQQQQPQRRSPWEEPSATGGSSYDPFQSTNGTGTTNGTGSNLDEDFDVLSSRMSPAKTTETSDGGASTDPWDMSGMQSSLANEQPKRTKTPQEFLGTHSGLVNLDELVKPDEKSKKANNPFATPQSTNPFEQSAPVRVPMSQLQANAYNTGFTQPSTAVLLPAPMMPMATNMQPQQQSSNPFL